jgi:hypothetical protein
MIILLLIGYAVRGLQVLSYIAIILCAIKYLKNRD